MSKPWVKLLTVEDMKCQKWGSFIFVKVAGVYRWADRLVAEHCQLVDKGEVPEAAGTIGLNEDYWKLQDGWSMSLKIGCNNTTHVAEITVLLGVPFKGEWE